MEQDRVLDPGTDTDKRLVRYNTDKFSLSELSQLPIPGAKESEVETLKSLRQIVVSFLFLHAEVVEQGLEERFCLFTIS